MFILDVVMLMFTIRYGIINGEKVVEYSDFASGFRSTVLFISGLDVIHSLIGFVSVCKNFRIIGSEILADRT